jgi:hypothetical protein
MNKFKGAIRKLMLALCLAAFSMFCALLLWARPSFNADSLDDSYFSLWLGRKGYCYLQWSDVPESTQHTIASWLPKMSNKTYPSIVSYAPGLIIHAKGFEVNFIGDMMVINYDSKFGTRNNKMQIARKTTKVEKEIKSEISQLVMEKGVGSPPLSNRQKWLKHLKQDFSYQEE